MTWENIIKKESVTEEQLVKAFKKLLSSLKTFPDGTVIIDEGPDDKYFGVKTDLIRLLNSLRYMDYGEDEEEV